MHRGDAEREPVVSLIMAVRHPRPEWFREAVASAAAQDGVEIEVIVVDDGSDEPVAAYVDPDDRVTHLRIEHAGIAGARNAGVAAARGDYLRYVDGDDFFPADSTRRLLDVARPGETVIAHGVTMICDEDLQPIWALRSRLEGRIVERALLGLFTVRLPSLLFPRAVVEATGAWEHLPSSEDWDYVLRALEHAPVRGTDAVAAFYRRHGTSATSDSAAGIAAGQHVVERYFERHPEGRGSRLERRARARLDAMAARTYLTRRQPRRALPHLARAAVADPVALALEAAQTPRAVAGRVRRRMKRRD